ncbi:MAG: tyrosine-type recombinase/integrase [Planctomycetaceae bacterium]
MTSDSTDLVPIAVNRDLSVTNVPQSILVAGPRATFAWDEFFSGSLPNWHTRTAYLRAVRQFLEWATDNGIALTDIEPGNVGIYFNQHTGSLPTKKLHLSAIKAFFNVLVNRHVMLLNPAATVRCERYQVVEGKTPEISRDQARQLLSSIETVRPVGKRDHAIIACLIYTAARAGAVASLKIRDLVWDGTQYSLRFAEKGGKSRSIPVRADLQKILLVYLSCLGESPSKDSPLFRSIAGRKGTLTDDSIRGLDICRMMKRRLVDAGMPTHLSPHSCRVATVTDLLTQGIALEDVQYLAGHSDPRTTRLYDRRQKQVTRNTVERISI